MGRDSQHLLTTFTEKGTHDMTFIQIIEATVSDIDEMRDLEDQWEKATEGKRTTSRRIIARDRENPGRYFNIVFFDSYESAMTNSNLPETTEFAARFEKVVDGPATFHNLDVIDDRDA